MCYGYNPDFTVGNTKDNAVPQANELAEHLKQIHDEAKAALTIANRSYERYYNEKQRQAPKIKIGSKVYLDGSNIQTSQPSKKLDHKQFGPYKVIEQIGKNSYKLELPKSMRVHPVFHVSLLFPKPTDDFERKPIPLPPIVTPEGEEEYEVEKILDSRLKHQKLEYYIKWKGYGPEESSWEPKSLVANAPLKIAEFH
ncbi:hypothetical protein BN14_08773 [Rhizoctonia solani AG-1 IB]|uniref:Chromo domain-containing protein n=1 Tax=Thanatephorus cucumeris (strain AG1-IB / isolate 7/3/14) TaxID=1108050 RepID=M5C3Z2_THACB|nr:hypothetical protein BN14_08773 [Rhizoctonia solani AG-1 IB]